MELHTHPDFSIRKLKLGRSEAPLLVVDNFISEVDYLVEHASKQKFEKNSPFYPGVRADTPDVYKTLFLSALQNVLIDFFDLEAKTLKFNICHYSLVTTPPSKLHILQRIPHFDSTDSEGLAAVHYLFRGELGGTSFYRHRKTGFEFINEARKLEYFRSLEEENDTSNIPKPSYINGDTPLFERIGAEEGVFNRVVIYRRNSLHSGSISETFIPDSNPLTGRLSINSFIDPA